MNREDLSVFGEELEYEYHVSRSAVRHVLVCIEDRLTAPITDEEIDAIASKLPDTWPDSGPYTLDTLHQLNRLHERAAEDGVGYSLSYMPNRNEFAIQTINSALEQTETKSDSLFAVVMGTRKALCGGE